jgi:hypothetical protein
MKDSSSVRLACAIYRLLLAFYPREHRREYASEMAQLFRDQCREAARAAGLTGLLGHSLRIVVDFLFSAAREHASAQITHMKQITPSKASLILIVFALILQQSAATLAFESRPPALWCLWLATLALVARGISESMRPASEWRRALLWTLGIAVAYGFICPVWAHIAQRIGLTTALSAAYKAHLFAFIINLLVPLVKTVMAIVSRPKV